MRPNFLVIGSMKCGTTSLCNALSQHPQVYVCNPKEPAYFCDDELFANGWSWYESLFAGADARLAIGEGSTGYTKALLHPSVPERISSILPEAKLIYIVRHPLRRIESHWLHLLATGIQVPPLREALQLWPHIVDTSLYWKQITLYRRHFHDKQILVLFLEDLIKHPYEVMNQCYRFLGVDSTLASASLPKPSHVTADVRVDGAVIRFLQKVPGARAVKSLVPTFANRLMEKCRVPLPGRPIWPSDLRDEISCRLADDSRAFLTNYGKPASFWQLD